MGQGPVRQAVGREISVAQKTKQFFPVDEGNLARSEAIGLIGVYGGYQGVKIGFFVLIEEPSLFQALVFKITNLKGKGGQVVVDVVDLGLFVKGIYLVGRFMGEKEVDARTLPFPVDHPFKGIVLQVLGIVGIEQGL